jgi:hypothetical protein
MVTKIGIVFAYHGVVVINTSTSGILMSASDYDVVTSIVVSFGHC